MEEKVKTTMYTERKVNLRQYIRQKHKLDARIEEVPLAIKDIGISLNKSYALKIV